MFKKHIKTTIDQTPGHTSTQLIYPQKKTSVVCERKVITYKSEKISFTKILKYHKRISNDLTLSDSSI